MPTRPEDFSGRLRGLYAITPEHTDADELLLAVSQALLGGARILQYRDKRRTAQDKLLVAQRLLDLCRGHDCLLIINDDVRLALAVDADGVHLGSDDGELAAVREALGHEKVLGASCYADFELARASAKAGADYVAFGAVYSSPTKPLAARAPLALFARGRAELPAPVCAIGGITLDNAPSLAQAGADMIAVISDLFGARDIAARATAFQRVFAGA